MKLFKIGIYVRVSTEEQAENPEGSIKNQEERLREFVKLKSLVSPFGEIREVFVDAGISAKDMNRPALQRLLRKIEAKEIDLVLVTELSRFTRSIKDFSILWEFLEKHDCKFLSIKDNFDTSTAAGEMVMYMMANVAQFERKQTAERISHSFLARAKRGLYNGGSVPLGYEVDPEKPGHLKIVPDEAEIVREVFAVFLKQETLAKTAKAINEKGITVSRIPRAGGKPRTGIFRIDMVHTILRNKAYIGVRTFQTKDGWEECKAMWEPIVSNEVFGKAQGMLSKNRFRKRSHLDLRYPFTLSGICYCKTCGDRMSGKSAHGRNRKVPYYEHAWATKHQAALSKKINKCDPHRLQAEKIEPLVWQEVKRFLSVEEMTKRMLAAAEQMRPQDERKGEEEKLRKKAQALDLQMEALAERIARLPKGVDERVFMAQMAKLQEAKNAAEAALAEVANRAPAEEVVVYDDFVKFTAHLRELVAKADHTPEIQAAIIKKLVHRIEVTPNGFEIDFHVGKGRIKREVDGALDRGATALSEASNGEKKERPASGYPGSRPLKKFLKDSGSKRLTNGGGSMARTPDHMKPKKNATEEKLRATPFRGVDTLESEENAIRLSVWRRFTESKVVEELLSKPEFDHVKEELQAGLSCFLNGGTKDQIYKIFSEGKGMKLEVNKKFAETLGEHQTKFFQGVVQAGIEGYGALYMQVKGLLSRPNVASGELAQKAAKK